MPESPYLINKHRSPFTPYDVYIGRPTATSYAFKVQQHYGNPFTHKQGTLAQVHVKHRAGAVRAYAAWLCGTDWRDLEQERRRWILEQILAGALYHKVLACFCVPLACHGEILIQLSEEAHDNPIEFRRRYLGG